VLPRKTIFWLLIAANLIGTVYGFIFYYGKQMLDILATQPELILFIPDSPLHTLFLTLALLGVFFSEKRDWFYFFAFAGALKIGAWTTFVLLGFQQFYFAPEIALINFILLLAHIVLFFEAFLLIGKIELKKWFLLPPLIWFLVGDYSDYILGTHPPIPVTEISLIFSVTVAFSIIFTALTWIILSKWKKPIINLSG